MKNIELHPFINNFLAYLKASEGVICLAGHSTLSENLVFNKPSFVIPIQNHIEQLANARVIEQKKWGKVYYIDEVINDKQLHKLIDEFIINKNYYTRQVKNSGFKGLGAIECAEAIINQKI